MTQEQATIDLDQQFIEENFDKGDLFDSIFALAEPPYYMNYENLYEYNLFYEEDTRREQEKTKPITSDKTQNKEVLPQTQLNTQPNQEKPKKQRGRNKNTPDHYCNIDEKDRGKQPSHSKSSPDNIRRKLKVHFFNFIIKFLNAFIRLEWKGIQKIKFRIFDHFSCTKQITIEPNVELFSGTIRDLMSRDVSSKYKCEKSRNKSTCADLSKQRPEVFNKLFDMTVRDFYLFFFLKNLDVIKEEYGIELYKNQKKDKVPLFFCERCELKEKESKSNYLELLKKNSYYLELYRKEGLHLMEFYLSRRPKKIRNRYLKQKKEFPQPYD